MKWVFLLLALLIPGLANAQNYNAQSYTAGSFNTAGCGGAGGVCFADLTAFAVLQNGTWTYCKDCQQVNPCAGGGTGAMAQRLGNVWQCATAGAVTNTEVCGVGSGPFSSLVATGPVNITGNSGTGTDQISGVNVNGIVNAATFPGTDIGAKVNAAIASMPNGGTIYIPAGSYQFGTTIVCPNTVNSATGASGRWPGVVYLIEGAGQPGTAGELWGGTILKYTGSDNAINDIATIPANQNWIGCQVRDLTIDGSLASGNAQGFVFGGVDHAALWNVSIDKFPGAGIAILNSGANMFTERYHLEGSLWENNWGINATANAGAGSSMGHGYINEWINVPNSGRGIVMSGAASFYSTSIYLDGNIGGDATSGTPVVWWLNGGSTVNTSPHVLPGPIFLNYECNAASCTEFTVGTNAVFGTQITRGQGGGPWGPNNILSGGTFEIIPTGGEHWISGEIGWDASVNADATFADFIVGLNGGGFPQGSTLNRFMCSYPIFSCTTYPTYQLYDRTAGAYVSGASAACPGGINDTVMNIPLIVGHTYTVKPTVAAAGCPTTPSAISFHIRLGGTW